LFGLSFLSLFYSYSIHERVSHKTGKQHVSGCTYVFYGISSSSYLFAVMAPLAHWAQVTGLWTCLGLKMIEETWL
jgi:hypothetical protein